MVHVLKKNPSSVGTFNVHGRNIYCGFHVWKTNYLQASLASALAVGVFSYFEIKGKIFPFVKIVFTEPPRWPSIYELAVLVTNILLFLATIFSLVFTAN
jgi:hypothetical protein